MGIGENKNKKTVVVAPERSEDERSESSRSDGATTTGGAGAPADPEVSAKAVRRQFSAAYKRRILQEADNGGDGAIAALLRREGLYASHLVTWRRQREKGEIAGLEPRKRGKKPGERNPLTVENVRLTRENLHLQKRLKQAETIIDVQKKLCDLLGLTVPPIPESEDDE
jgi:transposase